MNDSNSMNEQMTSPNESTDRLVDLFASINFVFTLGCLYLLILIYKHLENRDEELAYCEANENDEIEDEQVSNLSDKQIDEIESSLMEDEENSSLANSSNLKEDSMRETQSSNLKASSAKESFELISEEELERRLEYVSERLKLDSEWLLKRSSMLFGAWATDYTRSLNELNSKYKN